MITFEDCIKGFPSGEIIPPFIEGVHTPIEDGFEPKHHPIYNDLPKLKELVKEKIVFEDITE